jgi:hypothetical protein
LSGLATCVKKEVSMKKENNALHKSTLTIREELSEKACSSVPTDPSEVPSAAEAVDTAQEALESGLESMPAEEKKPKRKKLPLASQIFIAMILAIIAGLLLQSTSPATTAAP